MDEQIRSIDVKEFFLIKIVPIMFNLVYSKIQKLQQVITPFFYCIFDAKVAICIFL